MIYFRYLGNPINDRVQFLRSSENLWSPEKGFISCDNKIGEKQFLFISAPRQDRHLRGLEPWTIVIWDMGGRGGRGENLKILEGFANCRTTLSMHWGCEKCSGTNLVFFSDLSFPETNAGGDNDNRKEDNRIFYVTPPPMLRTDIDLKILVIDIKALYVFFLCSMSVKSCQFLSRTFSRSDLGIRGELFGIGVESSWRGGCTYLHKLKLGLQ